jgi:3-polyprenyl-4-hydroxybenzoate decarboxylase
MAKQDLRAWIAEMETANQLQKVSGAEREEEIGGIVDVYQRKIGNKALLFDEIPGFPGGGRGALGKKGH